MKYVHWELNDIDATQEELSFWSIAYPDDVDKETIPAQDTGKGDCGLFSMLFAEMIGCNQNIHLIEQEDIRDMKLRHVLAKLIITYSSTNIFFA